MNDSRTSGDLLAFVIWALATMVPLTFYIVGDSPRMRGAGLLGTITVLVVGAYLLG